MKAESSRKVGIFGGTFNPPHIAHLLAAESVRDHLRLDTVLFVPAAIPPHKTNELIVSPEHRLKMVRLAIGENPFFEVSDIELRRSGPSYTIDTLHELKRNYPDDSFFLILGIDLLIDFFSWKNPTAILDGCTVVAMNRPGFDLAMVDKDLLGRVVLVNVPGVDVSSTSIRRRVKSGRSIKYLVPPEVESYIISNSIYV
ncbi:MAG TPA: nicotinate-nucleotide adenylyltransferase [Candidatus Kryptonia bacterium]